MVYRPIIPILWQLDPPPPPPIPTRAWPPPALAKKAEIGQKSRNWPKNAKNAKLVKKGGGTPPPKRAKKPAPVETKLAERADGDSLRGGGLDS